MFRVQIRHQDPNKRIFVGGPVPSLIDAFIIIAGLEDAWTEWEAAGFPQLTPDNPIQFLESAEVYAVGDDGKEYWLDENDQFLILN